MMLHGRLGGDMLIRWTSGQRFTLSRDELLTLPEFVLLSLFPNGLLPDGHMNAYHEGDAFQVDVREVIYSRNILGNLGIHIADISSQYDPASLQYMLEFFQRCTNDPI